MSGGLISCQEQALFAEAEEVSRIETTLVGAPYLLQREFVAAFPYHNQPSGALESQITVFIEHSYPYQSERLVPHPVILRAFHNQIIPRFNLYRVSAPSQCTTTVLAGMGKQVGLIGCPHVLSSLRSKRSP